MKGKSPMVSEKISNGSGIRFSLEFKDFQVKIAETKEEKTASQRLRFEVFNVEMNEGLSSSWETGLDQDKYDEHADLLIVIDQNCRKVVGTYRMLTKTVANLNGGFYSEEEFDLTNLKNLPLEILEMGRSCVHKDYRSNGVINLLWAGIARYLEQCGAKYMFGCGSLHTHNVDEISAIYSYLKAKYYSDEKYRVFPLEKCIVPGLRDDVPLDGTRGIMKKIPPLLKGYFRTGALICGEPALDAEFGTTDFFILLPTENITKRYQNHYKTMA
jgi:putative hemolysin